MYRIKIEKQIDREVGLNSATYKSWDDVFVYQVEEANVPDLIEHITCSVNGCASRPASGEGEIVYDR